MKLDRTAAIAEIVSSAAIVATLAYLAIQSQQTNSMLLGNSRQAALEADLVLLTSQLANPEVGARILGYDIEEVQNEAMLISFMRIREYQWFQYQNRILDRDAFESYMSPVGFWLTSEVGSKWWAEIQGRFDPDFAEFVNEILERNAR